jgi:hypothetical protein
VLLFAAIPLETFVQATRALSGSLLSITLVAVAFVLEVAAGAVRQLGEVFVHLYDLLVIFPLKLEELVVKAPLFHEKEGESQQGSKKLPGEKVVPK